MIYQFECSEIKICRDCPLCDACNEIYCAITQEIMPRHALVSEKPKDCPLKELKPQEPCEYCKGFYEPYNFIWEYKTEKGDIRLHERVDTHYCPMCGRKLGEK